MHLTQHFTSTHVVRKQCFSQSRKPRTHRLLQLMASGNDSFLKLLWGVHANENSTEKRKGCMVDILRFQSLAASVSTVWAAIWTQALPCNRTSFDRGCPRRFLRIAGFNLCPRTSLQSAVFVVTLLSCWWKTIGPCGSQTTLRVILPSVGWDLNSFYTRDFGCFHSILWHLFSGSYISSQDSRSLIFRSPDEYDDNVNNVCAKCKYCSTESIPLNSLSIKVSVVKMLIKYHAMKVLGEWR
jgi:hypothetical protein